MILHESGEVSLKDLFDGKPDVDGSSSFGIDRLAFLVCRGGWPQAIDMRDEIALEQAMDYYDAVVRSDINRADNVQKNPERVRRLMRYMQEIRAVRFRIRFLHRIYPQTTKSA